MPESKKYFCVPLLQLKREINIREMLEIIELFWRGSIEKKYPGKLQPHATNVHIA